MSRTVLVVDDEDDLRTLLEAALARADYKVILAANGEAGLREFFRSRPDLVILDVAMPVMDGWTMLERVRHAADTPVIMLTAQGQEQDKIGGLRGGADDYVVKPFSVGELVARCEAVLRRSPP